MANIAVIVPSLAHIYSASASRPELGDYKFSSSSCRLSSASTHVSVLAINLRSAQMMLALSQRDKYDTIKIYELAKTFRRGCY